MKTLDARVIADTRRGGATFGNGIIDSPAQVGGWPELRSAPAPRDADGDGMPDDWERARGLEPGDAADRHSLREDPLYPALEVYLSELAGDPPLRQNDR